MAANIRQALASAGIHAQVQTAQQIMQQNRQQLQRYVPFAAVALLSALAGLLAVRDAVAASVRARRRRAGAVRPGDVARIPASVFLTEALCYAVLAWIVAVAIGVPGAAWVMRLISGGELLAWPFQPLAADMASGQGATSALLALALLVVTALLGAGPPIASGRHKAWHGSSRAWERPVAGTSSSEPGAG
jgi:hypothetical protein